MVYDVTQVSGNYLGLLVGAAIGSLSGAPSTSNILAYYIAAAVFQEGKSKAASFLDSFYFCYIVSQNYPQSQLRFKKKEWKGLDSTL